MDIAEFHPLLNALGPKPAEGEGTELLLRHDYLGGRDAVHRNATYTYTDGPAVEGATDSYEWMHGMDQVINALTRAGLGVRRLRESDELPWPRWPQMVVRRPAGGACRRGSRAFRCCTASCGRRELDHSHFATGRGSLHSALWSTPRLGAGADSFFR